MTARDKYNRSRRIQQEAGWLNVANQARMAILSTYEGDLGDAIERQYSKALGDPLPYIQYGDTTYHHRHHQIEAANNDVAPIMAKLRAARTGKAIDEDWLRVKAERMAEICRVLSGCYIGEHGGNVEGGFNTEFAGELSRRLTAENGLNAVNGFCERFGIKGPTPLQGRTVDGCIARTNCEKWWLRQLRKFIARTQEGAERDIGMVHKRSGLYASENAVLRRRAQKARNRQMLLELTAVNDLGESFSLADIAERGVANPAIRRGELMMRMAGFEQLGNIRGDVAEFYTFTTPSRYHARDSRTGRQNPKFDGSTPREGQKWLTTMWARIRAKLKRLSIQCYGFRVAEPHHDGTPHWHMLLYMAKHQAQTVRRVIATYLLSDDGTEPGATARRFEAKRVRASEGRATGYLAKYIAKNIDGYKVGDDFESDADKTVDATDSAERVDAWASTWGIRQFQQIGGPSVTIWRELRRKREPVADSEPLERARKAADDGDWPEYVKAMGGVESGKAAGIELYKEPADAPNQYGEVAAEKTKGVSLGAVVLITRERVWIVLTGLSLRPWSTVNNCTPEIDYGDYEFTQDTINNNGPPGQGRVTSEK